ncbi:hypothetical protein CI102_8708 [Trichoderma harzianum]|uniref:Transmembrane protein n=1 Tax=Trichoderma harzianum CBS 226.95 TaxID=983964 RepID=A0A2T4A5X1_TRIHA|nr:hypothetical protein M431DRAFT_217951 [Trichoderma harzianum CBS 226.95]PKK49917.1 hypothetical protein CI102_8708 [Trichoderma harzianum]PTB52446.1 hypothetical protein M431DRAFT_217951 [Trichoderma harzianum CBS 226.95]
MGSTAELLSLNSVFFLQREFGEEAIDAEVIQQTAHPQRDGVLFPFSSFRPSFFSSFLVMYFVFVFFYCFTVMKKCGVWDEDFLFKLAWVGWYLFFFFGWSWTWVFCCFGLAFGFKAFLGEMERDDYI